MGLVGCPLASCSHFTQSVSTERGAGVAAAVCLHSFVTMMDNTELGCVQL